MPQEKITLQLQFSVPTVQRQEPVGVDSVSCIVVAQFGGTNLISLWCLVQWLIYCFRCFSALGSYNMMDFGW